MATFNMAEIKREAEREACVPIGSPDPETGCRACGITAKGDFELCRQSYYLKQQTKITKDSSSSNQTSNTEIDSLKTENVNLKTEIIKQELVNKEFQSQYNQYFHLSGAVLILIITGSVILGALISFIKYKFFNKN